MPIYARGEAYPADGAGCGGQYPNVVEEGKTYTLSSSCVLSPTGRVCAGAYTPCSWGDRILYSYVSGHNYVDMGWCGGCIDNVSRGEFPLVIQTTFERWVNDDVGKVVYGVIYLSNGDYRNEIILNYPGDYFPMGTVSLQEYISLIAGSKSIEVSDNSIAKVNGLTLTVLKYGEFTLTVKGSAVGSYPAVEASVVVNSVKEQVIVPDFPDYLVVGNQYVLNAVSFSGGSRQVSQILFITVLMIVYLYLETLYSHPGWEYILLRLLRKEIMNMQRPV